ncbi:Protein of unknown function with HXXEE motif-containing protein [Rhodovulum sp. ES.010]|uniref:HXXEE domain-containing protein n=1 Tax=Rhodovulum sp. ES.010 TaxID=1882821 RepID=UPI0009274331|nr:HXXEE domain-containing protein [Rhodovulum sp. ES.010]SIO23646.1 Protein of unknown function with HXXEE motif-containing protein [Rhodovulum sp. ES.010]
MKRLAGQNIALGRIDLRTRSALLFVVYALRNAEETLFMPGWLAAQRPDFLWPGPAQYAVAAALLTLTGAAIVILSNQGRHSGAWAWIMAVFAGALLMATVGQVLMSLGTLSLMPGAISGVALQAPLALWVLAGLVTRGRITPRGAALATLAGLMLTPLAAGGALRLAAVLMA